MSIPEWMWERWNWKYHLNNCPLTWELTFFWEKANSWTPLKFLSAMFCPAPVPSSLSFLLSFLSLAFFASIPSLVPLLPPFLTLLPFLLSSFPPFLGGFFSLRFFLFFISFPPFLNFHLLLSVLPFFFLSVPPFLPFLLPFFFFVSFHSFLSFRPPFLLFLP